MLSASLAVPGGVAAAARAWMRLDLVENTVEGPAFDRCQVEATREPGQAARWRLFYGEARDDASGGWTAVRTSSGCAQVRSTHRGKPPWSWRGAPYLLVDVTLGNVGLTGREVHAEAELSLRRLTGFSPGGAPVYETTAQQRILALPADGSAVIPILIATAKEADEFRVRELLLRFQADVAGSAPAAEYGELAIAADVPRAEIFLDGGPVGRTWEEGPVVLGAVRVGEREILVEDASGRQARAVARVDKGRRTSVSLTLLKDIAGTVNGLRPLGPNRQGAEELWREKDGVIVVRIPGGALQMGSPEAEGEPSRASPAHRARRQLAHGQDRGDVGSVPAVSERDARSTASQVAGLGHARGLPRLRRYLGAGQCVLRLGRRPASHRGRMGARGAGGRRTAIPLGKHLRPLALQHA